MAPPKSVIAALLLPLRQEDDRGRAARRLGRLLLPEFVIDETALHPGKGIEERGQGRKPADIIPVSGFAGLRPESPAVGRGPSGTKGLIVFFGLQEHGRRPLAVPKLRADMGKIAGSAD